MMERCGKLNRLFHFGRSRTSFVEIAAILTIAIASIVSFSVAHAQQPAAKKALEKPTRLLDRQPFDRITLNAANGGELIDTLLLEFPNRRVPNPLPTSGNLELRRLSEPSVLYNLPWSSIAKIELYEQLLLNEAISLVKARNLPQSYEYLSFLHKNYPDLNGLDTATAGYLRLDAQLTYAEKNYEATLTVLLSLYELDPNQRGLKRFVETVTDRMIQNHLAERDFGAARSVLDLLNSGFSQLKASNVASWQEKFEQGAKQQISLARRKVDQEDYSAAREALRQALAILPDAQGVEALLEEINRRSPQIVVAVDELRCATDNELAWTSARTRQLTDPQLVNLVDFGAEGGKYDCPWADLTSDDTGLQLDLSLNQAARQEAISPETVAMELIKRADPAAEQFRADFAELFRHVEVSRGNRVQIHWQRSHVRPESLLTVSLSRVTDQATPPGEYQASRDDNGEAIVYRAPTDESKQTGPETIIERYFDNEEAAVAALLDGEIDVIARLPPWQISRLQQTRGIVVLPYRLPTVHVLIPNYDKPLLGRREFRRALCYGIDRPQILTGILLGGEQRAGFRVLSAPTPAGVTITDPVGYAYNQGILPRTYEPRLAAVLAAVARNSLAKLEAMRKNATQANATADSAESTAEDEGETEDEGSKEQQPTPPIVLAHPSNPAATTACQTMKLQLGAIGIPVELRPLDPSDDAEQKDYDLLYAELAIWEPVVDVRRLLGPEGVAGHCSSSMSLALDDVERAKNWNELRERLKEVHEIAYNDLPVIPLWQTVDYFAYRRTMQGIGETPVTLYQNVVDWKRTSNRSAR